MSLKFQVQRQTISDQTLILLYNHYWYFLFRGFSPVTDNIRCESLKIMSQIETCSQQLCAKYTWNPFLSTSQSHSTHLGNISKYHFSETDKSVWTLLITKVIRLHIQTTSFLQDPGHTIPKNWMLLKQSEHSHHNGGYGQHYCAALKLVCRVINGQLGWAWKCCTATTNKVRLVFNESPEHACACILVWCSNRVTYDYEAWNRAEYDSGRQESLSFIRLEDRCCHTKAAQWFNNVVTPSFIHMLAISWPSIYF